MDFLKEVAKINDEMKELKNKKKDLFQIWIKEKSPVKIGDIVIVTDCSYHGKKIKVKEIFLRENYWLAGYDYYIMARGPVLKKDGTERKSNFGTYRFLLNPKKK